MNDKTTNGRCVVVVKLSCRVHFFSKCVVVLCCVRLVLVGIGRSSCVVLALVFWLARTHTRLWKYMHLLMAKIGPSLKPARLSVCLSVRWDFVDTNLETTSAAKTATEINSACRSLAAGS